LGFDDFSSSSAAEYLRELIKQLISSYVSCPPKKIFGIEDSTESSSKEGSAKSKLKRP
jgi:hypothetical protein